MKKFPTIFFAFLLVAAGITNVQAQELKPALTAAFQALESAANM
jgi:hypothetical protein